MAAAGAYVVVSGSTFRVLGKLYDDVVTEIRAALESGAVVGLDVVGEKIPGSDVGQGTLLLHGAQLASVAVLAGPLPAGGQPISY